MEHSAIVDKNSALTIFTFTEVEDPYIYVYKIDNSGNFESVSSVFTSLELQPDYYKTSFITPDEDCHLCILFGDFPTFVRVGEPDARILYYGIETNKTVNYRQINANDGSILESGNLDELGFGFYNKLITNKSFSIVEINDPDGYTEPNVLKLPYTVQVDGNEYGYNAVSNFLNTGYNTIAFLGNEFSEYDDTNGQWIISDRVVKVIDLCKAVSYKYNKDFSLNYPKAVAHLQPNWIGHWIKYIKTSIEDDGRIYTYVPGNTPSSTPGNFDLVAHDELGNTQLRGLMIMLTKSLETLETGEEGIIFDFKNESE